MGVRGLQTFIEKSCPNACKLVSIQELANAHRAQFNCDPVLVVDGMNIMLRLYQETDLDWIYGGQYLQFADFIEEFVENFKKIGVKLVFFFDGTTDDSKRNTWIERRLAINTRIANMFNEIKLTFNQPDTMFFLPMLAKHCLVFKIQEVGVKVFHTTRDADIDMAYYAFNHEEVFAILSQDSDFIIYNTKQYLSSNYLDFDLLETILYDRDCFATDYLGLNVKQLPLFACLNGNDYIPRSSLEIFHAKIRQNKNYFSRNIMKDIANVIKREKWIVNPNDESELERISCVVIGHSCGSGMLRNGLKTYEIDFCAFPPLCIDVHFRFKQAVYRKHSSFTAEYLFNLVYKMEYETCGVLDDVGDPPSALVYREVRQRSYGVLFNCFLPPGQHSNSRKRYWRDIVIKEWCAYHDNMMRGPENVYPLEISTALNKNDIPSIEDLWFTYDESKKLKMFWAIWQIPMDLDAFLSLPKHLIVFACILNYLIGGIKVEPLLEPWQVAVFVAQALWKKNIEELEKLPDEIIKQFYGLLAIVTSNTVYDIKTLDWSSILEGYTDGGHLTELQNYGGCSTESV